MIIQHYHCVLEVGRYFKKYIGVYLFTFCLLCLPFKLTPKKKRESIFQKLTHVNFKLINRVKNNTSIYILNRYNFIVYSRKKSHFFLHFS